MAGFIVYSSAAAVRSEAAEHIPNLLQLSFRAFIFKSGVMPLLAAFLSNRLSQSTTELIEMSQSRQLAAIMFTDIVGYTALMGNNEQKAFQSLAQFKSIAQPLVEKFHGHWHKDLGDGALISFFNVQEAVYCAIAIQKEINQKADFHLRIGIHLGDITFKDGDAFGDGVNIASRIQSEATPGGICISESIARNVRNQEGMKAEYLGKRHLKNVDEPVMLFQLRAEGLIIHSRKQKRKISLASAILLVVATAIITTAVMWKLLEPPGTDQPRLKSLNINLPAETPLEFIGAAPFGIGRRALALSPDGQVIVYVAPYKNSTALFSRYLSSTQVELLPGTEGAYKPFFSPDGKWIGFFANDRLKKTRLDKREPTELCRASETWGACWTTKGKIIFVDLAGIRLSSVDDSGGDIEVLALQDKAHKKSINYIARPSAFPDGDHILFNDLIDNIYLLSLRSNEVTLLPIRGIQPVYIPSGHIAYIVNGTMYAIPLMQRKWKSPGNQG